MRACRCRISGNSDFLNSKRCGSGQVAGRIEAVRSGRIDIECGTTTWSFSQQLVDFSLITLVDGASMLVSGDSAIRRMSDTGGKRIAVIRGTTTDRALAAALAKDAVNAEIVRVDSREQGVAMLTEGRADAFASDRFLLLNIAGSIRSSRPLRLIDEDFSVEPMRSRFRAMTGLPARGQSQPRRIFRSGEINRVYARWLERFGQPSLLLSALYYLQAIPE